MNKELEILMVEDSETDGALAIRALSKHDLDKRLMWVKDGAEAIDFLLARGQYHERDISNKPKLVLLDLNLPKVSGLQVLENIRLNKDLEDIPVIVLTASEIERDHYKSTFLGVNAYIIKPLNELNFIKAIREIELYWYFFDEPPASVF
jgi:two-component system response regulator